jgi:hypothetical protein
MYFLEFYEIYRLVLNKDLAFHGEISLKNAPIGQRVKISNFPI